MKPDISRRNIVVYLIWATLGVETVISLWLRQWDEAFVAAFTLGLTFLPVLFERRFGIRLPMVFAALIVIFLFASLFLGEVGGFYERFWWWDVVLHSGSAIGLGLVGYVLVFMLFDGDRFAAPPLALAFLAFSIALSIGALWEVFEFAMDSMFASNMQKSGLEDTMWDLIVGTFGAAIGAMAGYYYQRGKRFGGLARLIEQFVKTNRRFFRKNK
ncbi:MAG: hypothetical protein L3J37_03320 [Rhodobacteraceae bacterium]|nr:hypothetical protein [Paracoccaceae bacterium]